MKKALIAAFATLAAGCSSFTLRSEREQQMDAVTEFTSKDINEKRGENNVYYGPVDNDISYAPIYDKKGELKGVQIDVKYIFKLKADAQGTEAVEGQLWPEKVSASYSCFSEKKTNQFSCSGPQLGVER